jgi:predicted DNA-binding ribbon-helix-helix protein
MRLERQMWQALHEIAHREGCQIHDLCSVIRAHKNSNTSLTAGIRVFLMLYFRSARRTRAMAARGMAISGK